MLPKPPGLVVRGPDLFTNLPIESMGIVAGEHTVIQIPELGSNFDMGVAPDGLWLLV